MNTDYLNESFSRLTRDGLPLSYEYDGRSLTASAAAVYQKLKFSEWGFENGYEQSIMAKCKDYPDGGHPATNGIIIIDGQRKRILNFEIDAARVGIRIDLGPEYPE